MWLQTCALRCMTERQCSVHGHDGHQHTKKIHTIFLQETMHYLMSRKLFFPHGRDNSRKSKMAARYWVSDSDFFRNMKPPVSRTFTHKFQFNPSNEYGRMIKIRQRRRKTRKHIYVILSHSCHPMVEAAEADTVDALQSVHLAKM